jgi:hypothetical protein
MISSMLGGERVSEAFAGFLHAHTDGVPLAIEESMRLLGDRAHLVRRHGAWVRRGLDELQVPPTVRDATLERTRRLPRTVQRVLEAAAVLGASGEAVVANVADLSLDDARAKLAEAFARGLLTEPKPGHRRRTFPARPGPESLGPLGRLLIMQGDAKSALAELEQAVEHIAHHPLEAARAMTYLGWAVAGPGSR